MPDQANDKPEFQPVHEAHAIEQLQLIASFAPQVLDEADLAKTRAVAQEFPKDDFPGRFQAAGGTISPGKFVSSIVDTYRRMAPDGSVENELRIDNDSVIYRTMAYTRWDAVLRKAKVYFDAVLPIYVARGPLTSLSVNYIDKFIWRGEASQCIPGLLLREKSPYVAPHVYSVNDLWHSHTGKFIRCDEKTKRLLNVNLDCLDEPAPDGIKRVVRIVTVATEMFNQPGYSKSNFAIEELDDRLNGLHRFIKDVFAEIITDKMSKRIALQEA